MKHLKLFEDFNHSIITLYHGTYSPIESFDKIKDKLFLSTSLQFSTDYGENLYKVKIKPEKVFDSTDIKNQMKLKDDINKINQIPLGDKLKEKDRNYFCDMVKSAIVSYPNTWYWVERLLDNQGEYFGFGFDYFTEQGYEAILITEWETVNYIIWDESVIYDFKFLGKRKDLMNRFI